MTATAPATAGQQMFGRLYRSTTMHRADANGRAACPRKNINGRPLDQLMPLASVALYGFMFVCTLCSPSPVGDAPARPAEQDEREAQAARMSVPQLRDACRRLGINPQGGLSRATRPDLVNWYVMNTPRRSAPPS